MIVEDKAPWKRIRFGGNREKAIQRDGEKCVECGITREQHFEKYKTDIVVHHKDGNGTYSKTPNNSLDNLETLCSFCHGRKDMLGSVEYPAWTERPCRVCKEVKPLDMYYRRRKGSDFYYRYSMCKSCINEYQKNQHILKARRERYKRNRSKTHGK